MFRLGSVFLEVVDRLLASPSHRVYPGVDDQANRTPHFVGELAELAVRIGIKAELSPQALAVQSPALDKRGIAAEAAELGHALELLCQRDLEVVTGHGFMERERFHLPLGTSREIVGVDEIRPGAMSERAARLVVRGGLGAL